jgi:2-polyprenyl-6-methoxyphenol hydroxylase-like FAD-dependent oxidoreductase
MTIFHNGMRVMRSLGVHERIQAIGCPMESMRFATARGRLISYWPLGPIDRNAGLPAIGLSRAELQEVLLKLNTQHLHGGASLVRYDEDASGVTATFKDGRSVRGDVLIGADGIASTVRRQMIGPVQPRTLPVTLWHGILPHHAPGTEGVGRFERFWGRGGSFGWYHIGRGRVYWYATQVRDKTGAAAGPHKPALLSRLGQWAHPVRSVLESTDESAITCSDVRDLDPLPHWVGARVALLGDAAHAMSFEIGQGACQAMEDGVWLTHHLVATPEIPLALRAYEKERRAAVRSFVRVARMMAAMATWRRAPLIAVRSLLLRAMLSGPGYASQRALANHSLPEFALTANTLV